MRVISNPHAVIVETIKGLDELGPLALKHQHYQQDKQRQPLGPWPERESCGTPADSVCVEPVTGVGMRGGRGRRNEEERLSLQEAGKKKVLCMSVQQED